MGTKSRLTFITDYQNILFFDEDRVYYENLVTRILKCFEKGAKLDLKCYADNRMIRCPDLTTTRLTHFTTHKVFSIQ